MKDFLTKIASFFVVEMVFTVYWGISDVPFPVSTVTFPAAVLYSFRLPVFKALLLSHPLHAFQSKFREGLQSYINCHDCFPSRELWVASVPVPLNSLDSSTTQCYPHHILSQKSSVYFFESTRKSWQEFFWNFRAMGRMLFHYSWWCPPNFPFRWSSFSHCSSPCRFKVGFFRRHSHLFLVFHWWSLLMCLWLFIFPGFPFLSLKFQARIQHGAVFWISFSSNVKSGILKDVTTHTWFWYSSYQ